MEPYKKIGNQAFTVLFTLILQEYFSFYEKMQYVKYLFIINKWKTLRDANSIRNIFFSMGPFIFLYKTVFESSVYDTILIDNIDSRRRVESLDQSLFGRRCFYAF